MTSQLMVPPPSDSELRIDVGGWAAVTWDEIRDWAGSRNVARGQSYQRRGNVREMILTTDGRLMATVVGNDKYQVSVWRGTDKAGRESLLSHCTCPVGHSPCKHAVAVIAEHLQSLSDDEESALSGDEGSDAGVHGEDSDVRRIVPVSNGVPAAAEPPAPAAESAVRPNTSSWDGSLRDNLRAKSHEELVDLVCSLMQRFSDLRAELRDKLGETGVPPGN